MPNSILHKRSSTAGVVPHAALLANGEIALNSADGTWFIKKTDGTVLDLRQPLITDGGAQPLAGINADAQDWQTRVIAAGGTVSASTFTAVNTFCNTITSAGLRDRFYRLNLFCGNNLAACLVPLYRGPSLTGTQFGNATDTNLNNNFVAGDYVETGVTGGLKGNGSNKALRTGLLPADMGGSLHLSVALMSDATVNQAAIGADNFNDAGWTSASIDFATPGNGPLIPRSALSSSVGVNFTNTISAATTGRLVSTSSRASGATQRGYFNGALSATNTPTYQTHPAFDFAIFGSNRKNTSIVSYAAARLSSYSIGVDMTDAQVAAFDAAVRAFQVALNRIPPVVSNADAQDWLNRVYAAGGSVSTTTATAVNIFCNEISNAGIRDRFYRLNLFCGDNLTACLVPLYRGQSLGGTQFGSATDGNNNFVSGDYAETGASGGLLGNGTNKFLTTGVAGNQVPFGNLHLSAYVCAPSISGVLRTAVSSRAAAADALPNASATLTHNGNPATTGGRFIEDATTGAAQATTSNAAGLILGTSVSTTDRRYFVNGRQDGVTETSALTQTTYPAVRQFCVYTSLVDTNYSDARLGAYSIGVGMTSTQVAAYYRVITAFQTALARRPAVPNADAQDWVNRVYAAGGTVSQSTADAVNTFCNTINSTGLRDRFYRLNLFCGNDLTACLVPLYRGQSLSGTQFGNTTDTNNNFTASDYNERGSPGGLRGNASNKYLNTGVISDLFASDATGHLAYYAPQWTPTTTLNPGHTALGTTTGTGSAILYGRGSALSCGGGVAAHVGTIGTGGGTLCNEVGNDIGGGHTVISRTGSAGGQAALYRNGVLGVTSNPFTNTYVPANLPVYVFAFSFLLSGNVSVGGWSPILMRGYSFGLGMTAAQALAYNNAMQAFQTALNRAV